MHPEHEDLLPWYRQVWPWILIALPASAVAASIATLIIANAGSSGAIRDDYYKEGLAINRSLERGTQAATLGLSANLAISGDKLRLVMTSGVATGHLTLNLSHATVNGYDQTIPLTSNGGVLEGQLQTPLRSGKWYVTVTPADDNWRLAGTLPTNTVNTLELKPDL